MVLPRVMRLLVPAMLCVCLMAWGALSESSENATGAWTGNLHTHYDTIFTGQRLLMLS